MRVLECNSHYQGKGFIRGRKRDEDEDDAYRVEWHSIRYRTPFKSWEHYHNSCFSSPLQVSLKLVTASNISGYLCETVMTNAVVMLINAIPNE